MSKPTPDDDKDQAENSVEELQNSIMRRLSKPTLSCAEPIIYEFTDDRALLHQYYLVRETMYRKVHNAQNMGNEDVYDKLGHILIARRGKLCIGGLRLIIREADEDYPLPLESPDFKIRDLFPQLPLRKLRHGEVSRFAVMDDDKDRQQVMQDLLKITTEKAIDLEVGYIFYKAPLLVARSNRRVVQNYCGFPARICTEIKMPEDLNYPEITWCISEVTFPAAKTVPINEDVLERPIDSTVH